MDNDQDIWHPEGDFEILDQLEVGGEVDHDWDLEDLVSETPAFPPTVVDADEECSFLKVHGIGRPFGIGASISLSDPDGRVVFAIIWAAPTWLLDGEEINLGLDADDFIQPPPYYQQAKVVGMYCDQRRAIGTYPHSLASLKGRPVHLNRGNLDASLLG